MKTYEARLVAALLARGYTEDHTDKSRYRAFKKGESTVFVGAYGALRVGACASRSRSVGDPQNQTPIYLKLLAEAQALEAQASLPQALAT